MLYDITVLCIYVCVTSCCCGGKVIIPVRMSTVELVWLLHCPEMA